MLDAWEDSDGRLELSGPILLWEVWAGSEAGIACRVACRSED